MFGCIFLGSGDWLMMYGNTAYHGQNYWLTEGVAQIPAWRNSLSMLVAFPAILLYGIALFTTVGFVKQEKNRKIYHYLTAFGLTPWLCLHLFYVMILYVFAWLNGNGYEAAALPAAEALVSLLPDTPFRIGFTNGLMSESMIIWFGIMLVWGAIHLRNCNQDNKMD